MCCICGSYICCKAGTGGKVRISFLRTHAPLELPEDESMTMANSNHCGPVSIKMSKLATTEPMYMIGSNPPERSLEAYVGIVS